jgi:histidinol phosphatase-like enzyme (inositol monophosphatase family)
MPYDHEIEVALKIAQGAGELALGYFEQETLTEEKADLSPVTIADRECEKFISRLLEASFPEDGIVGEEGADRASISGRRWLIDPIDGTRDFVRRNPYWSVQLALQDGGHVVLGIIHLPRLGETVQAVKGSGCYWNDVRVHVSGIDRLEKAVLNVGGFASVWRKWPPDAVRYLTEKCWTVRAYGGCYDVVMIARGKVDVWLSGSGMVWDYAPARIIAEECGASFLTSSGEDRIDADNCLLCAPLLEPELRRILGIKHLRPPT